MIEKHDEQIVIGATGWVWAVLNHSLTAAAIGRAIWHLRMVQKGERRFLDIAIIIAEGFGVLAGWIVGTGLAAWLGLDGRAAQGLVLIVSYIGPDGFQALLEKYLRTKT